MLASLVNVYIYVQRFYLLLYKCGCSVTQWASKLLPSSIVFHNSRTRSDYIYIEDVITRLSHLN